MKNQNENDDKLDAGYIAMAKDTESEKEAEEWIEGLIESGFE